MIVFRRIAANSTLSNEAGLVNAVKSQHLNEISFVKRPVPRPKTFDHSTDEPSVPQPVSAETPAPEPAAPPVVGPSRRGSPDLIYWIVGGCLCLAAGLVMLVLAAALGNRSERRQVARVPARKTAEDELIVRRPPPRPALQRPAKVTTSTAGRLTSEQYRDLSSGPVTNHVTGTTVPTENFSDSDRDALVDRAVVASGVAGSATTEVPAAASSASPADSATSPAATPPQPEPPAAAPNPLADLPSAFDLPQLGTVTNDPAALAATIGPLDLAGSAAAFRLVGGDSALNSGKFTLRPNEANSGATCWLTGADPQEGIEQAVADFVIDHDELTFRWLTEENTHGADALRNCILRIAVGEHAHEIALREPVVGKPLVATTQSVGASVSTAVPHLPSKTRLSVEVTGLGSLTNYEVDTSESLDGRGPIFVDLKDDQDNRLLTERVSFRITSSGLIEFKTIPMTFQGQRRVALDVNQAAAEVRRLQVQKQAMDAAFVALQKQLKKQPQQIAAATAQYDQQSQALSAQLDQLKALSDLCEQVHNKEEIHYRVFTTVGDTEMDILRTEATDAASAAEQPVDPAGVP